jgi:VanZ family protein
MGGKILFAVKPNMKKLILFLPSLVYYALIFILSSRSYQVKVEILFFDKLIHLVEFAVLGFLLSLGFFVFKTSFKCKFIWVFCAGSLLAVLDEFHQFFVPYRTMDALDMAADIAGIAAGFFVFVLFYRKVKWIHF